MSGPRSRLHRAWGSPGQTSIMARGSTVRIEPAGVARTPKSSSRSRYLYSQKPPWGTTSAYVATATSTSRGEEIAEHSREHPQQFMYERHVHAQSCQGSRPRRATVDVPTHLPPPDSSAQHRRVPRAERRRTSRSRARPPAACSLLSPGAWFAINALQHLSSASQRTPRRKRSPRSVDREHWSPC